MNKVESEKLKVLIYISALGTGGAEHQLARLVKYFDKNLFEIEVAYCDKTGYDDPGRHLEESGVKLTYLDRDKWGRLKYLYHAHKFYKEKKYDIVHSWTHTANIYGTIPAYTSGVPVVIGGMLGQRGANGKAGIAYSIVNWNAAGWIVNSEVIRDKVEQRIWGLGSEDKPCYVVLNGIEFDDVDFKVDQQTYYDDIKTDRPVVGIVGRLVPIKNHSMLIESARLLKDKGVDVDFWIIGDGPLKDVLKHQVDSLGVSDRVKLLGQRSDIDAALNRMDILALTSDSEGCPNAVIEALRASKPVIVTNCGSMDVLVDDGKNGFIVPVNDHDALAEKIEAVLSDRNAAIEMGKRGYQIARDRFAVDVSARAFQDVYIDCALRQARKKKNRALKSKLERLGLM